MSSDGILVKCKNKAAYTFAASFKTLRSFSKVNHGNKLPKKSLNCYERVCDASFQAALLQKRKFWFLLQSGNQRLAVTHELTKFG